jgi:hypothetical protein
LYYDFAVCISHTDPNPNPIADTIPSTTAQAMIDTCEKYCEEKKAGYIDAM